MKIPGITRKRDEEVRVVGVTSMGFARDRLMDVITQLKIQAEKLNRTSQRLAARGKELFEMCVRAEQERDKGRATIYANEIAQLRKISRTILKSQLSLEKVILRLETVKEFGDVMNVLGPATSIIRQVQSEISGLVPEVAYNLRQVDDMLESIIVEAGSVTGASVQVMVSDSEAQRILEEAAEIAAQRMKSTFPDLPEGYKHLEETSTEPKQ
ncbi:MAG: Snf7 family protein [Thaumarchaeota archaeon]|jgi:division protein CdvB (Snf7/Vps24/ESCRT-III family)|nr:Snf7 family protein [Candidatus Terraquivivens yellowstonensis]